MLLPRTFMINRSRDLTIYKNLIFYKFMISPSFLYYLSQEMTKYVKKSPNNYYFQMLWPTKVKLSHCTLIAAFIVMVYKTWFLKVCLIRYCTLLIFIYIFGVAIEKILSSAQTWKNESQWIWDMDLSIQHWVRMTHSHLEALHTSGNK